MPTHEIFAVAQQVEDQMTDLIPLAAAIEDEILDAERTDEMKQPRRILAWLLAVIAPPRNFEPIQGRNSAMRELLQKGER